MQRGLSEGMAISARLNGRVIKPTDREHPDYQLAMRQEAALQRGLSEGMAISARLNGRVSVSVFGQNAPLKQQSPAFQDSAAGGVWQQTHGAAQQIGGAFGSIPTAGDQLVSGQPRANELEGYYWGGSTRDKEGDRADHGVEMHYRPFSWSGVNSDQRVYGGITGASMFGSGESSDWQHEYRTLSVGPSVKYVDPDWSVGVSARLGQAETDVWRDGEGAVSQSERVFQPSVNFSDWSRRNQGEKYFPEARLSAYGSFTSHGSRSDGAARSDNQIIGARMTADIVDIPVSDQVDLTPGVNLGVVHENWRGETGHQVGPNFQLRYRGTSVLSVAPLNLVDGGVSPLSGGVSFYGLHRAMRDSQIVEATGDDMQFGL